MIQIYFNRIANENNIRSERLIRMSSALLALAPIMVKYVSLIPGVNLGEIFVILAVIIVSFKNRIHILTNTSLDYIYIYIAYIWATIPVLYVCIGGFTAEILSRAIRFTTYVLILCILANVIDWKYYIKIIEITVYINIAFIVLQYIVYSLTGRYLQGYGYILRVGESLSSVERERIFAYSFFRPAGLFTEPSHFCQYSFPALNYILFDENKQERILPITVISFGILLSTSLWGYAILGLSLMLALILKRSNFKKIELRSIGFIACIIIIVIFFANSSVSENTLGRLDIENIQKSASFSGRFMTYQQFSNYDICEKLIGKGYGYIGDAKAIGNSVSFILSGTGCLGLTLVAIWLLQVIYKSSLYGKVTLFEFMLLMLGSTIFNSLQMPVTILAAMNESDKQDSTCLDMSAKVL